MNVTEAVQSYIDNAGYQTLEQAELYQAAIRVLVVLRPQTATIGGESISFNGGVLASELDRVSQFIRSKQVAAGTGGRDTRVRTYDHSSLRD